MQIYKFYKREIRSNSSATSAAGAVSSTTTTTTAHNANTLLTEHCDSESALGLMHNGFAAMPLPSSPAGSGVASNSNGNRVLLANGTQSPNGQTASLICYNTRSYHHPYYYQIEDGTIVAFAPESALIIEDSPPSYEMALLCPSVTHHQYAANTFINPSIQVILPKEQLKEKSQEVTCQQPQSQQPIVVDIEPQSLPTENDPNDAEETGESSAQDPSISANKSSSESVDGSPSKDSASNG